MKKLSKLSTIDKVPITSKQNVINWVSIVTPLISEIARVIILEKKDVIY